MTDVIIVGLISAVSSLGGSGLGVMASSRLTNYRLSKLEEQMQEFARKNDDVTILKEQMKGVIEDVKELKKS